MTTQRPQYQKPRSRWGLGCGCAFAAVFIFGVAVAAFLLLRSRLTAEVISTRITSPTTDQQVEVNQPLSVLAGATYPSGVSRVEVYADGALVLAQDTSGQGETTLVLAGTWTPLTSGRHVLLARGYGADDQFADSEVVNIDVTEPPESITVDVDNLPGEENPSLDVLAQYLGTTPEELARRNPGTDPSAPLPPGSRVEAPRPPSSPPSESPPRSPSPRNPAAPTGLSGTADCTSANLTWTASPDAQSYRVYRLGPGDARPSRRVDGLRATTYRDTLPAPGTYRYQIASVRGGLEGLSLMFTVSTPAGCPAPPGAPPGTSTDLVLTVAMVDTDEAWDGVYCYLSVNGRAYDRIPAGDSNILSPEAANNRYYNLTRLPGGGRVNLTGQPLTSPVTLRGECVGRRGPNSTGLGGFSISHPQPEWDGTLRAASGGAFRFSYCIGPSTIPCTPTIPGVSRSGGLYLDLDFLFFLPAPTNLRRTTSTEACEDLPDLLDRISCGGSPILCLFGGCEGRQTIFWNWEGTPFVPESSLTGYTVFRYIRDSSTGFVLATDSWNVNRRRDGSLPRRFLSQDNELRCDQRVEYRVQANQAARHSGLSDPIFFETVRCATAAHVRITFDTLQVGPVNDAGEGYFMGIPDPVGNANLEVQGYIYTVDGRADTQASTIYQNSITGTYPYYYQLEQGTYRWSTLVRTNSFTTLVLNNSQTLTIGAAINEVDTEWTRTVIRSTTPWCVAQVVLPARNLEDWGRSIPITLTGGNAEASCTVTGQAVGTLVR